MVMVDNRSIDVNAKQQLYYQRLLLNSNGLDGGFVSRYLNR